MQVHDAKFVISALSADQFPRDRRPEIAFVGRSNVGKSSILNRLLKRKGLAKTSSTPGKTQTINFFDINGKFYFVDLPGYGYAKVPKALKNQWVEALTSYLENREHLKLAVALIDARHAPTANDFQIQEILGNAEVPTLIVATKIDKLKQSERAKSLKRIRKDFDLDPDALVVASSSETGEGTNVVWEIIEEMISTP